MIRSTVAGVVLAMIAVIASGRGAYAQSIEIIEPANGSLDLGPVNIGTTSSARRIAFKNTGADSPRSVELSIDNPVFQIVASGGDLEPDHTAYWDLVASPLDQDFGGRFTYRYRNADGDDFETTVLLSCDARNVPFDAEPVSFSQVGPTTIATRRVLVVNTSAAPREIVAITSTDATFAVKLRGGNLPLTLAPEGAIELEVRFAPIAALVTYEASIAFTLADGTTQVVTQATGSTSDYVVFRASGIEENTPVGAPWRRYGSLANYTSHPIVVTGLASTDPEVAVVGITVGDTVPAHTEIPLLVQITPLAPGAVGATLTVSLDTAPSLTADVHAFGSVTNLEITTDDDAPDDGLLDFGTLSASSSPVTRTVTIHNAGAAGTFIDCINFYAGQGFTTAGCPTLIPAGASVEVDVTFTPGTPARYPFEDRRAGGFRITELGRVHYVVGLTAVIPSYAVALSADRLMFADTVRSPTMPALLELTLTNAGTTSMPVPAATVAGIGFRLASLPSPGPIAPLASVVYRVAFEPPAAGAFDGVLSLAGSDDVALHGAGVLRPVSADAGVDFGAVAIGSRARRTLALHNAGAVPVSIAELAIDGSRFEVIAPAHPTIPAGGDLAIEIEYAPVEAATHAASLAITLDGDPEPQLVIALKGTGVTGDGAGGSGDRAGCSTSGEPTSAALALGVLGLIVRRRHRPHRPGCA